jgi:hypothetical protein
MDSLVDPDRPGRSVATSIAFPVAAVAAAALVGWLLLLFVKGLVVIACYAVGAALVAVPLVMARRLLTGHRGAERWRRVRDIATAVVVGAGLLVTGYFVARHGWLLIAVPAGLLALSRLADGAGRMLPGRHDRVSPRAGG